MEVRTGARCRGRACTDLQLGRHTRASMPTTAPSGAGPPRAWRRRQVGGADRRISVARLAQPTARWGTLSSSGMCARAAACPTFPAFQAFLSPAFRWIRATPCPAATKRPSPPRQRWADGHVAGAPSGCTAPSATEPAVITRHARAELMRGALASSKGRLESRAHVEAATGAFRQDGSASRPGTRYALRSGSRRTDVPGVHTAAILGKVAAERRLAAARMQPAAPPPQQEHPQSHAADMQAVRAVVCRAAARQGGGWWNLHSAIPQGQVRASGGGSSSGGACACRQASNRRGRRRLALCISFEVRRCMAPSPVESLPFPLSAECTCL